MGLFTGRPERHIQACKEAGWLRSSAEACCRDRVYPNLCRLRMTAILAQVFEGLRLYLGVLHQGLPGEMGVHKYMPFEIDCHLCGGH